MASKALQGALSGEEQQGSPGGRQRAGGGGTKLAARVNSSDPWEEN